jgi:hypothetical protein
MKFTKMSLVAALLIGSSAFAIDNIKMSGNAQLNYSTSDAKSGYAAISNKDSLFSKDNSAADAALNLNITADLAKNDLVSVSAGAGYTVLSTLGLENNLVSNVWGGAHTATVPTGARYASVLGGAKVENANWMNEAWVAVSLNKGSKSTLKLGRMELDTPLAFTETWSIEKNTFEAAVVVNQDIPDTTLVGAYVGNGNGTETFGQDARSGVNKTYHLATAPVVNANGQFTTYGTNGAYAVGVINNSFKPVVAQAWYYDVSGVATAYWLQADLKCKKIPGLLAGAQYTSVKAAASGAKSDNVYAVMLGYEMKDIATFKAAYSSVNNDGSIGYAGFNTATNVATAQSKLYTEAWWNYGQVTMSGTDAYHVSVEGNAADIDLGFYFTYADHDKKVSSKDLTEYTLTASKSFGPLDATVAYINYDLGKKIDAVNMLQAYLTLNF